MFTAWGYEIDESGIPPLLDIEAFNTMTGGKYADDALLVSMALNAASEQVRTACGWHVSPNLPCTCTVMRIGDSDGKAARWFALPSNMVTGVTSVTESGVELTDGEYEWARDGLMRRACFKCWPTAWNAVTVKYDAGFDVNAAPGLQQAVLEIVSGVLALTPSRGVVSESADGVSISYASNMSSVAAALTDQQRNALAPYRLVSSHAA